MPSPGVGVATGIKGSINCEIAVLTDSRILYQSTRRGFEKAQRSEYLGLPGFRATIGSSFGVTTLLALVPPYPQAIVEAVRELYILGARRVVFLGRAFRLKKSTTRESILMAQAAIPLDSISRKIAPPGVPLLTNKRLLSHIAYEAERKSIDFIMGTTLTVDTPRAEWIYDEIEDYVGLRDVYAVDSVTAPLYSLQYRHGNLEVSSILLLTRLATPSYIPIEQSLDAYSRMEERDSSTLFTAYIAVIEAVKRMDSGDRHGPGY